jgi:hypothetical protein
MEGSNDTMQNEGPIICINKTKVNQVMEERENQIMQTEIGKVSRVSE